MRTTTLYIGNKNISSWSMRAWLCAKYVGLDFEEVLIPLRTEKTREETAKISPSKKIPALHHNGLIIWDSLSIAEYLNEIFPEKNLLPENPRSRAMARSICAEIHSGFADLRSEMSMDMKLKTKKEPNEKVRADIDRVLEIWKNCAPEKNKFLFGNFSAVDAFFAPIVSRFETYSVSLGELENYADTIRNMPLYKEWKEAALKENPTS